MSRRPDTSAADDPIRFKAIVAVPRRAPGRRASGAVLGVGYQADRGHVETVRWLAGVLGVLVLIGAAPALGYLNLATAPGWARVILLIALLQLAYLVWMAVVPDWSTLWVAMLVFAAVAAFCALGAAVAVATPADRVLPLGLDAVRQKMARWCGAAVLLNMLATYVCGRTSVRWQHACRSRAGPFPERRWRDKL
jgi:hypothetical protein